MLALKHMSGAQKRKKRKREEESTGMRDFMEKYSKPGYDYEQGRKRRAVSLF